MIYLNAEIAKAMCDTIHNKFLTGKYDSTLNFDEFVYEIKKDLIRVSHDNHINISPAHFEMRSIENEKRKYYRNIRQWRRDNNKQKKKREEYIKKYRKRTGKDMFDYGEIKILPGNIGYLEIKDFNSTSFKRKENQNRISLESVMKFLKNTNSIIIDFRENLGGYVFLSAKLCSYFSQEPNSYFINTESIYRYDSNKIRKEFKIEDTLYTDNDIDNSIIKNKKIFILISKRTFSAAELSTYKLKQLSSHAIIIGEKTTGGGNGHNGGFTHKYYSGMIPCVRVFDALNSNYTLEAKGIAPDIITTSDSAFAIAYSLSLSNSSNLDTGKLKTKYYKREKNLSVEREDYFKKEYDDYIGNYRKIVIAKENEKLYMIYDSYVKRILFPEAYGYFLVNDFQFVKFIRNKDNKVIEIQIKHKDGYLEKFSKL